MDQESLPAEGPEPRQVIGVVYIVANSDYLMETLNLNTHHLKNRNGELFLGSSQACSPVMALKSCFCLTLILLPSPFLSDHPRPLLHNFS